MPPAPHCPFCDPPAALCVWSAPHLRVVRDAFPVSPGHTLVVPERHVASLFELSTEEQAALWAAVAKVREELAAELRCDGFNVGLNDGPAAGQTVPHAHIHVIPRFAGDAADPRGGVRWVVPGKAAYWRTSQ